MHLMTHNCKVYNGEGTKYYSWANEMDNLLENSMLRHFPAFIMPSMDD